MIHMNNVMRTLRIGTKKPWGPKKTRFTGRWAGKKRSAWSDASIMSSDHSTSLWSQGYDLGLLQLVRSRLSNYEALKIKSADFLNVLNEQVIRSVDFLFPWRHGRIPRQQCQLCKEWFREHEESFPRVNWPPQSQGLKPIESLGDVLEKTLWNGSTLLFSKQHLGLKFMPFWTEIKCCDVAQVCRNDAMPNEPHNQS